MRELENVVEYAIAVCEGQTIHVGDLPRELHAHLDGNEEIPAEPLGRTSASARREPAHEHVGMLDPSPSTTRFDHLPPSARAEARAILDALQETRFRKADAAELLAISRTTLWRRMREYGL